MSLRPRTIVTVLLLSAGCTKAPPAADRPPPAADRPPPAGMPAKAPPPPPVVTAPPPPPPPEALNRELAKELKRSGLAAAKAAPARFRALCDADGYPLVGNVGASKAPPPEGYAETLAFCEFVRDPAHRGARRG
jgi:hypothetical protein